MSVFLSVLSFIIVLVPLVIFHEFGHFFSAKFFKIKVLEFGFGFPPKLFSIWTSEKSVTLKESLKDKLLKFTSKNKLFLCLSSDDGVVQVDDILDSKKDIQSVGEYDIVEIKKVELSGNILRYKEMQWSFNLLPLGGFVRPFGEESSNHPDSFYVKSAYKRLVVLTSGVLVNAVLPFFLFFFAYLIPGDVPQVDLIISEVMLDSPAEKSDLRTGDKIIGINGKPILDFNALQKELTASLGDQVSIEVKRGTPNIFAESWEPKFFYDQQSEVLFATPRWNPPDKEGALGVSITSENPTRVSPNIGFLQAIDKSIDSVFQLFKLAYNSIKAMIIGSSNPQFSGPAAVGPIGIGQITGSVAAAEINVRDKLMIYIELISILSLSLAFINLLPIPALDGGRILFVLIEILRRGKKIPPDRERLVNALGFLFMISLLILISVQDVIRIYQSTAVVG